MPGQLNGPSPRGEKVGQVERLTSCYWRRTIQSNDDTGENGPFGFVKLATRAATLRQGCRQLAKDSLFSRRSIHAGSQPAPAHSKEGSIKSWDLMPVSSACPCKAELSAISIRQQCNYGGGVGALLPDVVGVKKILRCDLSSDRSKIQLQLGRTERTRRGGEKDCERTARPAKTSAHRHSDTQTRGSFLIGPLPPDIQQIREGDQTWVSSSSVNLHPEGLGRDGPVSTVNVGHRYGESDGAIVRRST
jgi:hypothetical protein